MENAVDALQMGFAVLVFAMAVALAFAVFSQARYVSDLILFNNDKTNFEEYIEGISSSNRIVGLEAVIPSIRRYIYDNDGYAIIVKLPGTGVSNDIIFDILKQNEDGYISGTELKEYYETQIKTIINTCKSYENASGGKKVKFEEIYEEVPYKR